MANRGRDNWSVLPGGGRREARRCGGDTISVSRHFLESRLSSVAVGIRSGVEGGIGDPVVQRLGRSVRERPPRSYFHGHVGQSTRSLGSVELGARARAIAWAREIAWDPASVYLDTETTGLGPDAEVVEIALVAADGLVLLDTLVRPVGPIPAAASRIHGISDADVAGAPDWRSVHETLCGILAERPVVVYNAPFDRRIVAQCCGRHRLADPFRSWQCAMRAYAEFRATGRLTGGGYRWHKLGDAAAYFGAAPGGHRAAADAQACRAVVIGMANAGDEG